VAKFPKYRVYDKAPEESILIFVDSLPEFSYNTVGYAKGSLHAKNQLDPSIDFISIELRLVTDRQTDTHRIIAIVPALE